MYSEAMKYQINDKWHRYLKITKKCENLRLTFTHCMPHVCTPFSSSLSLTSHLTQLGAVWTHTLSWGHNNAAPKDNLCSLHFYASPTQCIHHGTLPSLFPIPLSTILHSLPPSLMPLMQVPHSLALSLSLPLPH
ncbi:hypothetical protein E2C01_041034 [Portunus trituberculatus]|uniref:Uncharacterized protein n=1 Tax=Portunus trituberculatus TaxID=210409 RepID=A0A5B7FLC7_PORTR|nr:hypothetical protein [Portunus trituberculatus]